MKSKHLSLVALLLVFSAIVFSAWYTFYDRVAENAEAGFESLQPLSEIEVPDSTVLAQMDVLERGMHLLSAPSRQSMQAADLSVLGYVPLSAAGGLTGGSTAAAAKMPAHRVTLAFDGRGKRFCVIDSELYSEGAVLPDGATIVKIESRRVLIAKEQRQRWLVVDSIIDSALIGKS